ncbi:MAG: tetratricopeptide repeat protein [Candidatus Eisenbacteria bacterium]|uniref:Tetratricopeptide repeat protein n=1 Tax=Eiseniibacteriota bacterium TaxID=2212470 RepID=A0A849SK82_UNCEI|nr:tetratricopeptide repeat protein [Candidatus Eisenbacteria bacterium]
MKRAALRLALLVSVCVGVSGVAIAAPAATPWKPAATAARPGVPGVDPEQLVRDIQASEEQGLWRIAADKLQLLRSGVPADPDLDLWLAWYEARAGRPDSAQVLLDNPVLMKAANDSLPMSRWQEYPWKHSGAWGTGRFEGWHWYVWRTRLELAAARGDWNAALAAARRSTSIREVFAHDWWLRGLCAAQLGKWDEARESATRAMALDPILPEAKFLSGYLAWRDGRREVAVERFTAALAIDTTYHDAGLALIGVRRRGSKPPAMPTAMLSGLRRAALLISPEGPKMETFQQFDLSPNIVGRVDLPMLAATGKTEGAPVRIFISLLLDAEGDVALVDVPHYLPSQLDPARVAQVIAKMRDWDFSPAIRNGEPRPAWASQDFTFQP